MAKITITYTADITDTDTVDDRCLKSVTADAEAAMLKKRMQVDTVKVRNFKVFVHDDKGEDQECTKEKT